MIVHHMAQASPDWWESRRGIPSASNFHRLISGAKAIKDVPPYSLKPTGSRSYMAELIGETSTLSPNYFTERDQIARSRDTERGRIVEPEAREWFAMHHGTAIHQVGWITNDDETLGCSPDGVIGGTTPQTMTEGLELKCPKESTHAAYLFTPNEVPKDYLPQVHGALAVTGLNKWHFVSYCPGQDPIHVVVQRDWYTEKLEAVLQAFLVQYHAELQVRFPKIAAVMGWREWLADDPPLAEFNQRLPEMSALDYPVKRQVWRLVQNHAHAAGLEFNPTTKTFGRAADVVTEEAPF